jgi:hypothetical protein
VPGKARRGDAARDRQLFGGEQLAPLRAAVHDLSWLWSRGYAPHASIEIVGNRYQLYQRQRTAVRRSSCSDASLSSRRERERPLEGCTQLAIDGFNLLITIESALSGGLLLLGRDGCLRDLASIHGTYRSVEQTPVAIELVADHVLESGVRSVEWLLDRPVSNSGRLRRLIEEHASREGLENVVKLVDDPDPILATHRDTVVSSDARILDGACSWVNLARWVVEQRVGDAWVVDLSTAPRGLSAADA